MKNLAESIRTLPSQLDRLKDIPKSSELYVAIVEFPGMMKEVVDFIEKWLESWSGVYLVMWDGLTTESLIAAKHILVPYETEAIELRKKVDGFRERFTVDLMLKVQIGQGLVSVPILIMSIIWFMVPTMVENDVKIIQTDVANIRGRLSVIPDQLF